MDVWTHAFNVITDIVTLQDTSLAIIRANTAAHRLLQADDGSLVGRYCYEVLAGRPEPCPDCPLLVAIEKGSTPLTVINNEKLNKVFHVSSSVIPGNNGEKDSLVHIARDITQEREAETILRESEKKYRILLDKSPDPIFSLSSNGQYEYVNRAFAEGVGKVVENIIGKRIWDVFPKEEADKRFAFLSEVFQTGEEKVIEVRVPRPDGDRHYITTITPIKDTVGKVDSALCSSKDITKRKRAEELLRENESKLRLVFDNANDEIYIHDHQGRMLEVNPLACERLGYTRSELLRLTLDQIDTCEEAQLITDRMSRLMKFGQIIFETVHRRKDGFPIPTEVSARNIVWGDQPAVISICRDISERRRIEKELTEKSEELERYFLLSMDLLCIADTSGEFIRVNQEWEKVLGYSIKELNGRNFLDFVHPEDMEATLRTLSRLRDQQDVLNFKNRYRRKDGTYRWIEWRSRPKGDLIYAVARDITERNRIEEQLRESEDKFSLTFKSSPDAVNINRLDDGLYVDINEGFTRITGFTRDDVIGKTSLEINLWHNPADRKRLVDGLREKGFFENLEAQFRRKDGILLTGLMSARIISLKGIPHLISITRDITKLKTHEKEQLKIEKLESLGILAGGIAHDFNNVLTGIMGNISFAKVFLDADHASSKPLAEAEKAAVRAGELAHQLLTFSRGGKPIKKVISLPQLVEEAVSLVLHGSNVKEVVDIPQSIHALEADEGQMSQVFHNIIINAMQAMPGGGLLTITAQNEVMKDNNALSLHPGPYIRLLFADQGCGIAADDLKKIFDPYFTTKPAGTGLGLASAYSIVSRHGGYISADSAVGKGTTFTLHLPSIGKEYSQHQRAVAEQMAGKHKGGSILVMDDEEMIRDIAATMLAHLGYEVTTCKDGEKAIELYTASVKSGNPYSMVIMDLTIPGGLGGRQAAEQILALFPDACLVVSSGYSHDPIMSNYRDFGFSGAIAKPYNMHVFQEVLGSLLMH